MQVTELAPLAMLPHCLVDRQVLRPMRTHVGGTALAAALAVVHGWAINLGGGMHHAHRLAGTVRYNIQYMPICLVVMSTVLLSVQAASSL